MLGRRRPFPRLAAWSGATLALATAGFAAPMTVKSVPPSRSPVSLPRNAAPAPLPDSLLARVEGRPITATTFWKAVASSGVGRPDSLTPLDRERFLDLLVEKEALGALAARERWTWTVEESAQYLALRDRLVLTAALDSVLALTAQARRAAGAPEVDREALGVLARDSAAARLHPRFDKALVARLTVAFDSLPRRNGSMSVMEQLRLAGALPKVSLMDSLATLAETDEGPFMVAELLEGWRRLNPIYRPRVTRPEQIEDLARNGMFERALRREARRRRLDQRPDIAYALAQRAEYVAVSKLVAREVYAKIPTDSLTLLRHYRAEMPAWRLPPRARVMRLVLASREAAEGMRARLSKPAEAESLSAIAARNRTSFEQDITAEGDSALYALAVTGGPGAVFGPDSVSNGWRVVRVVALEPARNRTFEEARGLVSKDWYDREGERRMRDFLERSVRRVRVERELRRLAALQPPASFSR